MNRLVLIGNGFDLAHNLKTRYSDFMLGLFKFELMDAENKPRRPVKNSVKDATDIKYKGTKLFTIHKELGLSRITYRDNLAQIQDFDGLQKFLNHYNIKILFPKTQSKGNQRVMAIPYDSILKAMYERLSSGDMKWVDVESIYYEHLKNIINRFSSDGQRVFDQKSKFQVEILHTEFHYLKERLEAYLTELMGETPKNFGTYDANFWSSIKGEFSKSERQRLNLGEAERFPESVHILNFNYTDTIYKYEDHRRSPENSEASVDFNFIHGEINKPNNPMIFGYGDETDEHYSVLEKLNDNQLFEHIKSFGYFKTGNYHRLLRFLESDYYQEYIIGHSCGLSDRVMLKHIFEHKHCRSIQLFYYKWENGMDDYIEKTQEISRHFDDKRALREKIVPKPDCLPLSRLSLSRR